MDERPVTGIRKRPQQDRAKATVDAILEATAQVLVTEGAYASTTTNRIAERAGVSIGTLYQYFPNKDALIVGVMRSRRAARVSGVLELLPGLMGRPMAVVLRELVPYFIRMRIEEAELLEVLETLLPRLTRIDEMHRASDQLARDLVPLLEARREEVRPASLERAARFVVVMADQFTLSEVQRGPLTEEAFGELVSDIADAVIHYLCRDPNAQ